MVEELSQKIEDVKFGVLMIGAPGVGKSTFCKVLQQHMTELERPHCVINLDPANDDISYECGIDIRELITLEDVMTEFKLGPNGGMLYCTDFLKTNINWLEDQILA
jgi:GTPase SAR1 family protein